MEPSSSPISKLSQEEKKSCLKLSPPIETFRFIGPTYFSVKYYFNSNYNRSNTLLIRNERKPYFIEFLVDLANNGGTLNFHLVNNLVTDPNYSHDSVTPETASSTMPSNILRLLSDNNNSNSNSKLNNQFKQDSKTIV